MYICVYGAASNSIDRSFIDKSHQFGKILAERGHCMVFGGGTNGIMGALARGVYSAKGKIIGVSPKFFDRDGILFDKCNELILTEDMRSRKATMENYADAFAVMPGGVGTFEEMFEMFSAKQLKQHNKKIALYNINGYYDRISELVDYCIKTGFMESECRDMIALFDDPYDLFDYLEE